MLSFIFSYSDLGQLVLRLAVGLVFVLHGWPKLRDFKNVSGWFESIGIRPGKFWTAVVIFTEFIGGIALAFGFLTQIFAALMVVNMLVAIIKVKLAKERKFVGNFELDFMLAAAALALVFLGPGRWSLDAFFKVWIW